jgi:hypothetical protein
LVHVKKRLRLRMPIGIWPSVLRQVHVIGIPPKNKVHQVFVLRFIRKLKVDNAPAAI